MTALADTPAVQVVAVYPSPDQLDLAEAMEALGNALDAGEGCELIARHAVAAYRRLAARQAARIGGAS